MLTLLRSLLAGNAVESATDLHTFPKVRLTPPLPKSAVPFIIGGESAAAMARAARFDGWIGTAIGIDLVESRIAEVRASLEKAGRSGAAGFRVFLPVRGRPTVDLYAHAEAFGVTDLIVSFASRAGGVTAPLESKIEQLHAFSAQVLGPGGWQHPSPAAR